MRKACYALGLVLLVLLLVQAFDGRREAVRRAEMQAARLSGERDSLLDDIARRDTAAAALTVTVEKHREEAQSLRDSLTALERRRATHQLTVRETRTTGALLARLRSTFPEFGDSAWALTSVPLDDRDTIGIEYLMLPAWFAETFVIDHANAQSWRAQKDRLLAVDSLGLVVGALQDSIARLVTANAHAYQAGYDAAYAGFEDVSARYVAELTKPRITFRKSLGLIAAAGAGFALAQAIHE